MDATDQTALDALEAVIRGVVECQSNDQLKLSTETRDGIPYVTGFSVTRRWIAPDNECTLCFPGAQFIEHGDKLIPIGDYFIAAANLFLEEVLIPGLRRKGVSVGKLIAGSRGINLDKLFTSAAGHVEVG